MLTPLLTTKIYIPPSRLNAVQRSRLLEQLNAGLYRKLTLISAPAGFGKTTLASAWIAAGSRRAAWLSLDAGDREPSRFLSYLIAALQTLTPTIGSEATEALQSPQPPPLDAIVTTLLNDIASETEHFVLVLDDYHEIDERSIDRIVGFLLDHLPPQMHLAITTREDPQLPLARLRARDQVTELRAADLRCTPAEAAAFLTQVMALDLSADDVATLATRTEGWIAGLQLAALSMRGRDDIGQFVRAFAGNNRYIVDYLIEEVLQRQPEPVRHFLLHTSILERLSAPLCNAVSGRNDSRLLLETLERGNLFVVALDDAGDWFRYHHLFADVLKAQMLQEQPAELARLHRRASAWYAEHHLPADAIRHALAASDFASAADLIELAWPAMDGRFQAATWLGWARALPNEVVQARPVLGVAYAWALLNGGELDAAEARLSDAEWWLGGTAERGERASRSATDPFSSEHAAAPIIVDQQQFQGLSASFATAHAYLAQARGNIPLSVRYGQRALELLPEGEHLRRGPAAALLGLAQWASGELDAAYRALAEAMAGFQAAGNMHFAISVTSGLADIRVTQGRLREAIAVYSQALHLAQAHGEPLLRGTANLYLGLSELACEQGDLGTAQTQLLRSEQLGDQAALPDWRFRQCRAQARLAEAQGDFAAALTLLDEAERHFYPTPIPDLQPLAALRVRVWLAQGRLREALGWAHERGRSVDEEPGFLGEFEQMTLARVLIAHYRREPGDHSIEQATHLLDRLKRAAEAGGRIGSLIEIEILRALAQHVQGHLAPALVALEHALNMAEPEGYVRIFVSEGPAMARLLSAARRTAPEYIGKLLAAFPDAGSQSFNSEMAAAPQHLTSENQDVAEPLSTREREILELIAQGYSNSQIGARLFLAVSTVKGHNQRIFDKLQVQSRTEAVARARKLGLL